MRSIKLKGKNLFRYTANSIEVINPEKLKFIDGIAVAKICISLLVDDENSSEIAYGLINENFEEVFYTSNKLDSKSEAILDLMCLPRNLNISRFGSNDFIITVRDDYDPANKICHHVRLINKTPVMINNNLLSNNKDFPLIIHTSNDNAIINGDLYDVHNGKYVDKVNNVMQFPTKKDSDIKILKGIPIMQFSDLDLDNICDTIVPKATYDNKIAIIENRLYDIENAKFTTRKYSNILPLKQKNNDDFKYLVYDKIILENMESEVNLYNKKLEDTLIFVIDKNDQILSGIYSQLDSDYFTDFDCNNYEGIREKRIEILKEKINKSNEISKTLKKIYF